MDKPADDDNSVMVVVFSPSQNEEDKNYLNSSLCEQDCEQGREDNVEKGRNESSLRLFDKQDKEFKRLEKQSKTGKIFPKMKLERALPRHQKKAVKINLASTLSWEKQRKNPCPTSK
jgi:hypothetical protein